jgi:hypothetical protein
MQRLRSQTFCALALRFRNSIASTVTIIDLLFAIVENVRKITIVLYVKPYLKQEYCMQAQINY